MKRQHFLHLPAVRKKWLLVTAAIFLLVVCNGAVVTATIASLGIGPSTALIGGSLLLAWMTFRAMGIHKPDPSSSVIDEREDFPSLWDIVHQYCATIGRDPPLILIAKLDSDDVTSFAVTKDGPTLTLNEYDLRTTESFARVIIAHELGHYAGNDSRVLRTFLFFLVWLRTTSQLVFAFGAFFLMASVVTSHSLPQTMTVLLERMALGWFIYYWAGISLYLRLAHAFEFAADAIAADLVGSKETVAVFFEGEVMSMGGSPMAHTNPPPNFFDHPPHMDRVNALRGKK